MDKDVLTLFVREALECATDTVIPADGLGTWVEVQPGTLRPGDIVRVKPDAFTGDTGLLHNCRVGEVLWAESGEVIVATRDGKEPFISNAHYSPHILDRLASHPDQNPRRRLHG